MRHEQEDRVFTTERTMERLRIAPDYDECYLEIDRPSPLSDNHIESMIQDVLSGKLDKDISNSVYTNFKIEADNYFNSSTLNELKGLDSFNRIDIINGCTQYIDCLYMQGPVQVLAGDYRYHERLGLATVLTLGKLEHNIPLIIAMPFPSTGAVHNNMTELLTECTEKNIPVHIDAAWVTTCRDIVFDFSHSAIHSVGISLSKGLGLGWNRVGLRYTRQYHSDSVTIMNDYNMNLRAVTMIGLHFIRNLPVDYLWNKYGDSYYKICRDFNLTPTNSVYIALRDNQPVGLSPLIRYIHE
jgi:hypothetical protein